MDRADIELLCERVAEAASTKALEGFFARLGIDTSEPFEAQRDFAFLRGSRKFVGGVMMKVILTVVALGTTSGFAVFALGIKQWVR